MSKRLDLQNIFDKLIDAPFNTKVILRVQDETAARTTQSWFRTQYRKFEKVFNPVDFSLSVSRKSLPDNTFSVTIQKVNIPENVLFVYPKKETK